MQGSDILDRMDEIPDIKTIRQMNLKYRVSRLLCILQKKLRAVTIP